MNKTSFLGLLAAILLIVACFYPWVNIPANQCVISGVDGGCSNYGKPGYLHFFFSSLYILFLFIARVYAKRLNLMVGALNLAWAIKNFLVIGNRCEGGECPVKEWGIYAVLIASTIMMLAALCPRIPKAIKK